VAGTCDLILGQVDEVNLEQLFAVTAPGVAPYTAQELSRLGLLPAASGGGRAGQRANQRAGGRDLQGGVAFAGDRAALYRANLHLRTANRILVRLGEFPAVGFAELRKRAARLPWERCLAPGQPVSLRVTCHKSRLYHSDAVAERIAGAIDDRLGRPASLCKYDEEEVGTPPQLVVVRLLHDHCSVSVDSSGELLHRRGYRLATAKAPLRETLAATMLLASGWASGWDKEAGGRPEALVDPFCGSGTIAVEAAHMALGMAPGLASGQARHFAFLEWPDFDAALWGQLLEQAQEHHAQQLASLGSRLQIAGSDRDARAVELARANAARGGVADQIEFSRQGVSAIVPCCASGWIVTNPPYGLRVSAGQDVRNLYAQFGHVLRTSFEGWQLAVLCNDRQLLAQIDLPLDMSLNLVNGGLPVVLGRGRVQPPR
jgi:putative N6-adenine-specific DNA methylase